MNETLLKDKQDIERERSELSTALTETRSQNQKLQRQVVSQQQTLEQHKRNIESIQKVLAQKEIEREDLQRMIENSIKLDGGYESTKKRLQGNRSGSTVVKRQGNSISGI